MARLGECHRAGLPLGDGASILVTETCLTTPPTSDVFRQGAGFEAGPFLLAVWLSFLAPFCAAAAAPRVRAGFTQP